MPLPPISVAFAEDIEQGEPTKPCHAEAGEFVPKDASAVAEIPEAGGEDSGTLPDGTRISDAPQAPDSEGQEKAEADEVEDPEQAEAEALEAQEAAGKRKRRQGLHARVLLELKSTSPCDMKARLESQLPEQDALIAAAQEVEAEKQKLGPCWLQFYIFLILKPLIIINNDDF